MFDSLNLLRKSICKIAPVNNVSKDEIDGFKKNCTVVLMAGGEGSRFGSYAELKDKHKTLLRADKNTLIERIITLYRDAGIKDFVALVYHHADSIKDTLKDGSHLGVSIRYSHDPGKPVGKGGAILNALNLGVIGKKNHVIIHNPDDQIVGFDNFVNHIIACHISGARQKCLITIAAVEGTEYSYSGFKVENNKVTQIKMYPFIPIPTHIGVTIFQNTALSYFEKYFDLEHKTDFEQVLFPVFAEKGQAYVAIIPNSAWFSVNNPKEYKKFLEALSKPA